MAGSGAKLRWGGMSTPLKAAELLVFFLNLKPQTLNPLDPKPWTLISVDSALMLLSAVLSEDPAS